MPLPSKKMTANVVRPARYRPGKPSVTQKSESESSDAESEASDREEVPASRKLVPRPAPLPKATSFPKSALQNRQKAGEEERRKLEEEFETESEAESGTESESGSGSDEEDTSSEEESSSEEEQPRKLLRPVFLKKSQRTTTTIPQKTPDELAAEEAAQKAEAAKQLVQEEIQRAADLKASQKKQWDDDDNLEVIDVGAIDDEDDLDPEAEYLAWKLRELHRIKRARALVEAAEAERAELERRRNLTTPEREAEDKQFIEAQKQEREQKHGTIGYMSKYHHSGAFFQEELEKLGVKDRDLMGARFVDQTASKEVLPEYLRVRDETKIGRKGRTRYRDMKSEDTGRWGDYGERRRGFGGGAGGGGGGYNGDERFKEDRYRGDRDREGPTGANSKPLGERKRVGEDAEREGKRARVD
ncbi:hypothetical protein GQ43DRAFT_483977 [Delitschia confertaspora ATCC 74209]|uniref:Micro-fibrillar-associated protein 1 C-terminal domain-containing protein n=1 Tax=Delitschia confertaspora ATCC 74209 TaxID=1513339 RepID=A0A9P4JJ45_9PLEO|nr:hypothetical protein GQ43DRAFT_483977 [Delitschia confertaspora ATCC 74209]